MLTAYSDVICVESIIPGVSPEPGRGQGRAWSLSFRPDQDTSRLFPYINGARDDALWYARPEHVKFLLEGYRCILYARVATAHFFETRKEAMAFVHRFMGFLAWVDREKLQIEPNFHQIRQVPVMDVLKLLPGSNCRECRFSTCMAFAAAVAKGKAAADLCPGLGRPMSENAVYPVFDTEGQLIHCVSLPIDTGQLKQRIQDQDDQIRTLKAQLPRPAGPEEGAVKRQNLSPGRGEILTDREVQVLELIAQGHTNNEIGRHLFISPHTVKSHMINIFNKLNVSDRTQAAVKGVRSGLI